jgi:hypothetical protein
MSCTHMAIQPASFTNCIELSAVQYIASGSKHKLPVYNVEMPRLGMTIHNTSPATASKEQGKGSRKKTPYFQTTLDTANKEEKDNVSHVQNFRG